jgi:hypothetical protein
MSNTTQLDDETGAPSPSVNERALQRAFAHSRYMSNPTHLDEVVADVVIKSGGAERTVYRRLLGLPVRGRVAARVDRALAERGITPPPPAAPNPNRAA